jgi:hypothetical protein
MQHSIRRQLTLFVPPQQSERLEQVRKQFDPIQSQIIQSHITLCREDEIIDLDKVIANLRNLPPFDLQLHLDKLTRFEDSKGVYLPILNHEDYHNLRKKVLHGIIDSPRIQHPHLTLMHPRNAVCTDEIFDLLSKIAFPTLLHFNEIHLIVQVDGGAWETVAY